LASNRRNTSGKVAALLTAFALAAGLILAPTPARAVDPSGSVSLNGTNGYLDAGTSADWNIGTSDFTVEWFAYQRSALLFNRAFTLGAYSLGGAALALSIESGTAYVWVGGDYRLTYTFSGQGGYFNRWIHYAITRTAGSINLYVDGTRVATAANSTNIDTTGKHLYIGSEVVDANTFFPGDLTNFHFVNGTALYSGASATVPTATITPVANSKLLLALNNGASWLDDTSGQAHTVTAQGGATSSANNPFVVPSAPVIDAPTATSSGASITWSLPTVNAGGITDYEYALDETGTWTSVAGTTRSFTITGLTSGTSHTVRVRAVNGIGAGLQSSSQPFTVAGGGGGGGGASYLYVGSNNHSSGGSCADPDYHVTGASDDVPIQAAIDEAADGDTVYLCAGTFNVTSTLFGNDNTVLEGAGQGATILDGGATFVNHQYVGGGVQIAYSSSPLTISKLTMSHGAEDGGGAILAIDDLHLDSVTFKENYAGADGGAICVGGDTTILNSTFSYNTSGGYGGAIACEGASLTIDNSTFSHNRARYHGGAIDDHQDDGTLVTNSRFEYNTTNDGGGAIENNGSALEVRTSVFKGNHADVAGGALWSSWPTTVVGSIFSGNTAGAQGGAMYAASGGFGGSNPRILVSGSIFTRNKAVTHGGAFASASNAVTITRSTFTKNSSKAHGGAILLYYPDSVNISLTRNKFASNSARRGGGAITLGPCQKLSYGKAAKVFRKNRFSNNVGRLSPNVERWYGQVACD
jgi:predicted outer membrane repeat protein